MPLDLAMGPPGRRDVSRLRGPVAAGSGIPRLHRLAREIAVGLEAEQADAAGRTDLAGVVGDRGLPDLRAPAAGHRGRGDVELAFAHRGDERRRVLEPDD